MMSGFATSLPGSPESISRLLEDFGLNPRRLDDELSMSMHRKYKTIEEVARRSEDDARVSNHHQANPVTVDSAFGKSAPCSGSGILGL
jgi:hypothetical protein